MKLYPLVCQPRMVAKMWGGRELARVASKTLPDDRPIGESWEVFDFPPHAVGADGRLPGDDPLGWTSAVIADGPLAGVTLHQLMLDAQSDLLGDSHAVTTQHGPQFPLLVKFLDARQDLSVQVHPPQSYADTHANAFVKNECWYILDRTPGARILAGATPGTTRATLEQSVLDGTCDRKLNAIPVEVGQCYYLPSGTVHALGAGIVAAEVQTPSDTTYRVFDFNRVEPATGKLRALHVDQALDCIDFHAPPPQAKTILNGSAMLVDAPQFRLAGFKTKRLTIEMKRRVSVLMPLDADARVNGTPVRRSQCAVLPACLGTASIESDTPATLLVATAK